MKWPTKLPSFETLRVVNACTGTFCAAMVYANGLTWTGMMDAFICGVCFSAVGSITHAIRMKVSFEKMNEVFAQMTEINNQLIAGQVEIEIDKINGVKVASPPRLH